MIVNSFYYDVQMMFFILVFRFYIFVSVYNVLDSKFYLFIFYFGESFIIGLTSRYPLSTDIL